MPKEQRITITDLVVWMIAVHVAPTFFLFPSFETPAGQYGWIATLLATGWIGLGIWIAVHLWQPAAPGETLAEALQARIGPFAGRAINVALAGYFMFSAAFGLWTLQEMLTSVALSRTPSVAISGAMTLIVLMAVRQGIESIGRTVIFLVLAGLVSVATMVALVLPEAELKNLGLVFEIEGLPVVQAVAVNASFADFASLLPFLLPFTAVKRRDEARPLYLVAFVANGVTAVAFVLTSAVLSYPVARNLVFEFLSLVRYVRVAEFVERLDPLVVTGWIVLGYLRISAFFLAALLALRPVVGAADLRTLSLPGGVVVLTLSEILFESNVERSAFTNGPGVPFNLFFVYVLPALILLTFRAMDRFRKDASGRRPAGSTRSRATP